jgi:hypothetical protein
MTNTIRQWSTFELALTSSYSYANPFQEILLTATFVSDQGVVRRVDGFWDGGDQWKVRFSPPSPGQWRYSTESNDPRNHGLHGVTGSFVCTSGGGGTRFEQHGAVQVDPSGRHFVHADGTPFFYLADTAWNGPLCSTDDEWKHYLDMRVEQSFTAVQWVTTQWITAPDGDREGRLPFEGHEQITVNPAVFQRLDGKMEQIAQAGLLNVIVLLWAADWGEYEVMKINPGLTLPEDQAVKLARYMVARWGAHPVMWLLGGDCEYRGARADRWRRLGRQVFGGRDYPAPVGLHPNGMSWHADEFRDEAWLSFLGYQGCHFGDTNALKWAVYGPPATEWQLKPHRPIVNLEPPYENHFDISDPAHRFSADEVRRAIYWSLLVSPTAGVTYGGHGVWGWDDGTRPPTAHPNSGIPLPWREALRMPGAEQLRHLMSLFNSIDWWMLIPDAALLKHQPGDEDVHQFVAAARTVNGELAVVYIPQPQRVALNLSRLATPLQGEWFNPRTSKRTNVSLNNDEFEPPANGDWLLVLKVSPEGR